MHSDESVKFTRIQCEIDKLRRGTERRYSLMRSNEFRFASIMLLRKLNDAWSMKSTRLNRTFIAEYYNRAVKAVKGKIVRLTCIVNKITLEHNIILLIELEPKLLFCIEYTN